MEVLEILARHIKIPPLTKYWLCEFGAINEGAGARHVVSPGMIVEKYESRLGYLRASLDEGTLAFPQL